MMTMAVIDLLILSILLERLVEKEEPLVMVLIALLGDTARATAVAQLGPVPV
jgi:hypothetical protein